MRERRDLRFDEHRPGVLFAGLQLHRFAGVQADEFVAAQGDARQREGVRIQFLGLLPHVNAGRHAERRVVVQREQGAVGDHQVEHPHAEAAFVLHQHDAGVGELLLGVDGVAHAGARSGIPGALLGVGVVAVRRLQFAFLGGGQPMRAERVPAGVAVLPRLTAQGRVHHRPDALRAVVGAPHEGPDPVGIDDPLRIRDGDFRAEAEAEVLDARAVAPRHVVVEPRQVVVVRILRPEVHADQADVLEQANAAVADGVRVEAVRDAVAVRVFRLGEQHHPVLRIAVVGHIRDAVQAGAVRNAVAVLVLGEHQQLAGFLKIVVAPVRVGVQVVQVGVAHAVGDVAVLVAHFAAEHVGGAVRIVGTQQRPRVRAIGEGAVRVARIRADGDGHDVAVGRRAGGRPVVEARRVLARVVVQARHHDLAVDLHVVVEGMLEVGHARLLIALLADVERVANGLAAVVAAAGEADLFAQPGREAAQFAGLKAVQVAAGPVVRAVAEVVDRIAEDGRQVGIGVVVLPAFLRPAVRLHVAARIVQANGRLERRVVVAAAEGIAAAGIGSIGRVDGALLIRKRTEAALPEMSRHEGAHDAGQCPLRVRGVHADAQRREPAAAGVARHERVRHPAIDDGFPRRRIAVGDPAGATAPAARAPRVGHGAVGPNVGLRFLQCSGGVANRRLPIARMAPRALLVGVYQLPRPVGGTDDVVWPIGAAHAFLIADFHGEDDARALALGARQEAQALLRRAVFEGLAHLVAHHQAVEVLARHQVDDAGDGRCAVQRRCAVEDRLQAPDGNAWIEVVEVRPGAPRARAVAVDVGRHAVAIHHRQRGARAQAAQVGPCLGALLELLVVRAVELDGRRVGVDADLERLVEDDLAQVRRGRQRQIHRVHHVARRRQIEVGAPDVRAGHHHLLDFFLVLVLFVVFLLGAEVDGGE